MTSRDPRPPSLLQLLTVPFLAVVLLLAGGVAWLSYRSAHAAVDETARQWLRTTVQRIGDDITRQQTGADTLLRAAIPGSEPLPDDLAPELESQTQRFLAALRLDPQGPDNVTLVNARGQLIGLRRVTESDAERLVQLDPASPLSRQLLGARTEDAARTASDPREQRWYRQAIGRPQPTWAGTAVDVATGSLMLDRVRAVMSADGRVIAAVSTRLSLKPLQEALHALSLPPRGVAFVVENDGLLAASTTGPVLRRATDGSWQRVSVRDSGSALMAASYDRLLPLLGGRSLAQPAAASFADAQPLPLVASFSRITDGAGHDWTLIVAAPRSDFDAGLLANVAHTAAAALLAAALMLLIAAWIKRSLARDAVRLAEAMQRIGDGDLDSPPGPMHSTELGALRDHLHRLQLRLRTDRVTGLANREAILNRLHDRMRPGRRHNDAPLLALLFVDLDRFKAVNERHGHEAGDFVLQTLGRRLRQTVRDTDLVARWAGDEFVLLLDGVGTAEHAQRARDQVERVLRDPVELGPGRDAVELDGTVGLALSPLHAGEPDQLIRLAEEDMFQRKPSSLSQW